LTRLWFYFRIGYATYLTFILGAVNTLVVVWYLAIKDIPLVETWFGHFVPFAAALTLVGTPVSIISGWIHYKRSPAYTSEIDIQVEANPYNYKLVPGKEVEAFAPTYLELLRLLRKLMESQKMLDNVELAEITRLESKLQLLLAGGMTGSPRRGS